MKQIKVLIALTVLLLVLTPYHNGDLNHDGKVSITDLVIMRRIVEGITQTSPFADLNYDGKVDEKDLNILRHKLAR